MEMNFFDQFFHNINLPIIVYRDNGEQMIVYRNKDAKLLLSPFDFNSNWNNDGFPLTELFEIPKDDFTKLGSELSENHSVSDFPTNLSLSSGEVIPVTVSANEIAYENDGYVILYINYTTSNAQALVTAIHMAFESENADTAINQILTFAGAFAGASRSYIFESISQTATSNTYEWCAPGIEPFIDQLQHLPKDEYSYDDLVSNGFVVTDDIRQLPDEDRKVLEPQGIKSLAIIPITSRGEPFGYVGFDNCVSYHKWTQSEISLLSDISKILASLLYKRNTERSLRYSTDIMSIVTNNSKNIIHVTDITTKKLLFVNKAAAEMIGLSKEELVGKQCCSYIRPILNESDGCPLDSMMGKDGVITNHTTIREVHNIKANRWYLVHDSIVKWIDGRDVYVGSATDITKQKDYEAKLRLSASIDTLTQIYNRDWGYNLLEKLLRNKNLGQSNCLFFIDLDDLKIINDSLGHEIGDQMILKTIEVIKSNIRKGDTLCRWGGDEFVMVIRANEAQSIMLMDKIKNRISEYNCSGSKLFALGFSYGLVEINPATYDTVDELISVADKRMYQCKQQKKRGRI